MYGNGNAGVEWPTEMWQMINRAVENEACKVRTAQKVFEATVLDKKTTEIQDEVIDLVKLSIQEGQTKKFVEISLEFPLTSAQVENEATDKTCQTLSRMAAKGLALAEDVIVLQGIDGEGQHGDVNGVTIDQPGDAKKGLLGEAIRDDADDTDPRKVSRPIDVGPLAPPQPGVIFGQNVFSAVAAGIAKLESKGQAPPFALILPTTVYADTFAPPGNGSLITTADRIRPLVERGFYGTGTLPPDQGLLTAFGGDPTLIYMGGEARVDFERKQGRDYIFRVSERFIFVERDPRSLVVLRFHFPS